MFIKTVNMSDVMFYPQSPPAFGFIGVLTGVTVVSLFGLCTRRGEGAYTIASDSTPTVIYNRPHIAAVLGQGL